MIVLAMSTAAAQSPSGLIRRAALFYNGFQSVEVRGEVTEPIPGSSWRVAYEDAAWRAQPNFVPAELGASANDWVMTFGVKPHLIHPENSAKDDVAPTKWGFTAGAFGDFGRVADHLVDARSLGWETIAYKGQKRRCEILYATYDRSPDFKPKTIFKHRTLYIDPQALWILKVIEPVSAAGDATFTVTSTRFNEPPPPELMSALRGAAEQPKTKAGWVGHSLPQLTLPDLSGTPVNLAGGRGKPVLIDFWASWCGPCRRATALAQELANTYRQRGLAVFTITPDTAEDARLWLRFHGITLPTLLDTNGNGWKAFEIPGVPTAIFFDGRGKAVKYWMGLEDENDVRSTISAFFASRPAAGTRQ